MMYKNSEGKGVKMVMKLWVVFVVLMMAGTNVATAIGSKPETQQSGSSESAEKMMDKTQKAVDQAHKEHGGHEHGGATHTEGSHSEGSH